MTLGGISSLCCCPHRSGSPGSPDSGLSPTGRTPACEAGPSLPGFLVGTHPSSQGLRWPQIGAPLPQAQALGHLSPVFLPERTFTLAPRRAGKKAPWPLSPLLTQHLHSLPRRHRCRGPGWARGESWAALQHRGSRVLHGVLPAWPAAGALPTASRDASEQVTAVEGGGANTNTDIIQLCFGPYAVGGSHYLTGSPFLSWTLSRYKALSQVSEITRTVTAATTERARPGPKHVYAVIPREPSPPRRWELSLPRTGKDSQGQGERTLVQATPGGIDTPPAFAVPSEPHRIGALFPPE